jgi:glutaryl-CoA dehydrogenase
MSASSDSAKFNWQDPFLMNELLSEEERLVRDTARQYAQDKLLPRVRDAYRREYTDPAIFREMGEIGLLGATIEGYGCAGVNYVCYGLMAREVESVDSGYRSMMSVQSSLVMHPIYSFRFGSAAAEIPAETGHGRVHRLLRPDRAGSRLRPRRHAHTRPQR